jgi:hypothetical protein
MMLSHSIEDLRNQLDKPDNAITISLEEIKGILGEWFLAAQRLEAGAGDFELAKDYKSLKEEFETLKQRHKKELHVLKTNHEEELKRRQADRASELEEWESALSASNNEVNRLRAEQAERAEKEREILPDAFLILEALPIPGCGSKRLAEISEATDTLLEEVAIHLEQLSKAGLARVCGRNELDAEVWSRTPEGNRYVVARHRADRQAEKEKAPADSGLPEAEAEMLVRIMKNGGDWLVPPGEGDDYLAALKEKGMVNYHPDGTSTYGQGTHWFITGRGNRYLRERGVGED